MTAWPPSAALPLQPGEALGRASPSPLTICEATLYLVLRRWHSEYLVRSERRVHGHGDVSRTVSAGDSMARCRHPPMTLAKIGRLRRSAPRRHRYLRRRLPRVPRRGSSRAPRGSRRPARRRAAADWKRAVGRAPGRPGRTSRRGGWPSCAGMGTDVPTASRTLVPGDAPVRARAGCAAGVHEARCRDPYGLLLGRLKER